MKSTIKEKRKSMLLQRNTDSELILPKIKVGVSKVQTLTPGYPQIRLIIIFKQRKNSVEYASLYRELVKLQRCLIVLVGSEQFDFLNVLEVSVVIIKL